MQLGSKKMRLMSNSLIAPKMMRFGDLIALFLTNQNAGNTIDFKMNVIRELTAHFLPIRLQTPLI